MIYDYKCHDCSTIWEESHSIKVDDAVAECGLVCPSCSSINIRKYFGTFSKPPTIVFKGMGWVGTDTALKKVGFPDHYKENPEVRKSFDKNV